MSRHSRPCLHIRRHPGSFRMSHEETILYKWRYGDCCKEGTMWFVTYFTSMKRDLPNKRINYYHYMVLLAIKFQQSSFSVGKNGLNIYAYDFYFPRKGMQANCRYWICYRLIWKHWTKQLGTNEAIPKSVDQQT